MGTRTAYRRRGAVCALVAGVALLAAGCGSRGSGATGTPSPTASPAALAACVEDITGWRSLPSAPVPAATLGSGPAVVMANESGNLPCAWIGVAAKLVHDGYRAVLFTYADPTAAGEKQATKDIVAVARAAAGGKPYALVGASLGGRVVIEAAATHPSGLAAIVSLSGESDVEDYADITAQAEQVTTPALYVGARNDVLTQGERQQQILHRAMHGHPDVLLQVGGSDHGTDLFNGRASREVLARLRQFLKAELPT